MTLLLTVGIFFVTGFLVSFLTLPITIYCAKKYNFVDIPDGLLKTHHAIIPRLGGVPLYFILMGGCGYAWYTGWLYAGLLAFFLTLLFIVGLVDDFYQISQEYKFLSHGIIAGIFFVGCVTVYPYFFTSYFMAICGYFWLLTLFSAFNLIDVMDGLAAVTAFGISCALFLVSFLHHGVFVACLMALYCGGLGGFLWYNYPPARIYLGESGSGVMGGFLGAIALLIPWGTYAHYGWGCPVILFAIPLLELSGLIVIRSYKKIPFYRGSRDHFCHYLLARGYTNTQILWGVIGAQIILWFGAGLLYFTPIPVIFILGAGAFYIVLWTCFIYKNILLQKKYFVAKSGKFQKILD